MDSQVIEVDTLSQLVDIYLNHEHWHTKKLSTLDAIRYFEYIEKNNGLVVEKVDGQVVGYAEVWHINHNQWKRVIFESPFSVMDENIKLGNICYLHNGWINENCRRKGILKNLMNKVLNRSQYCDWFSEFPRRHEGTEPKIFSRKLIERRAGG